MRVRGCLHGETRTGTSFIPGWLRGFVSRLHDDWGFSSSHVQHVGADEAILDWQKLRTCHPFQSTCKPISHRNEWSFRFYMIPLRNLVPEWNSCPGARTWVNSRRGDSRRQHILWWYHVNKCRAMRGNRRELAPAQKSPRCHVNTPLNTEINKFLSLERVNLTFSTDLTTFLSNVYTTNIQNGVA